MADNTTLNSGSGGNTFRTLEDGGAIQWPVGVTAYAGTIGTPDVLNIVTLTDGLPVQPMTGSTWAATQSGTWNIGTVTAVTAISNALPAGTNAIGKLAANSGVDIGDVDVTSIIPGTGATNLGKAIDTATGATDTGVLALATRDDALSTLTPVEGDNVQLRTDANGALWVIPSGTVTISGNVTNAGTFAVQAAQSGTWNITNVSGTVSLPTGAATAAKQPALGTAGTASADVITVQGIASMTALKVDGSAVTQPVSYATTGSGTATGALRVELPTNGTGVIATVGAVTSITNALPAGTNAIGKLTANSGVTIGAVEIAASQTLATVTTVTTCSTLTTLTGGGVAHDGIDSGNPVKVGARAIATPSTATMVAAADRSDLLTDLDGALLVRAGPAYGDLISERITDTGGTSTAFTNFGATASTRNYITAIAAFNSSATAGYIDIRDGTGGSVLYTIPLPAGGGSVITLGGAPLFRSTANTALAYDVSAALSTVYLSVTGFKSKV